jgi:hypothetical protein
MFNNYVKNNRNQACLNLGFEQWEEKFHPRLKNHYKCQNSGCRRKDNSVACPDCDNSFYCSEECRIEDSERHIDICAITNTREMLFVDSFLGWKLSPVLSLIAMAKNKQVGPGVLNVRSYENIWDFKRVPDVSKISKAKKELHVYVTYIPLGQWKEQYLRAGLTVPNTVCDNNYKKKMVVNFNLEGMNKPQLHCLPLLDLVKSEPEGLAEFTSDPISRLNTFQVSFDVI